MKILMCSAIILFLSTTLLAQPKHAKERISMLKKVKLLEVLKLDESTSDKVLSKYSSWENKIEEQMSAFDKAEDQLASAVKSGKKDEIKSLTANFIKERDNIMSMATNRDNDMKTLLNDEQFAKYLIFEKRFRQELGKQIMKRRDKRD